MIYTITEVSSKTNDWNGPNGTVRYFRFKFRASDNTTGTGSFGRMFRGDEPPNAPAEGFSFVAGISDYDSEHDEWKFKKVQTPEQAEKYGKNSPPHSSSGSPSVVNSGDKMRSKEQCLRGEAIIAAAAMSKSPEEAISYAVKLEGYIADGKPTADQSTNDDDQIPF